MSADRRDKKKDHNAGPFEEHTAPDDYGPPGHQPSWGYETGGYGEPPHDPPVLEGQGGRQCDLRVVLFGAEEAGAKLADGSPRLASVQVTIRSGKFTLT